MTTIGFYIFAYKNWNGKLVVVVIDVPEAKAFLFNIILAIFAFPLIKIII